jgi:hypothetical protein
MQQLCANMRADLQRLWRDPASVIIHKDRPVVGKGGSGVVYAATVQGGAGLLAAKVIHGLRLDSGTIDGLLESGDRDVAALRRELVVMSRLPEGLGHICRCGWSQLRQPVAACCMRKQCTAAGFSLSVAIRCHPGCEPQCMPQVRGRDGDQRPGARHPDAPLPEGLAGQAGAGWQGAAR